MSVFIVQQRFDGQPRKMGLELEYTGLGLRESTEAVLEVFGGRIEQIGKYRYKVADTGIGSFTIELDMKLMHKLTAHHGQENADEYFFENTAEALLSPVITRISPMEIVTPPLLEDDLPRMETLVSLLRSMGAKGTGASIISAYGMHINADVPSLSAESLLAYLQAFVLLQDWLVEQMDMDFTRRVTQFAPPFPEAYAKHILQPGYTPPLEQLIDDYLAFNPTRNRALDMLPLFAFIDEARVRAVVKDELVRSRPTFHFRMPNCRIDEPDWTIATEVRHWNHIEKVAHSDELRRKMAAAFLEDAERLLHRIDEEWQEQTEQWLATA